jgi:hypothetical protein
MKGYGWFKNLMAFRISELAWIEREKGKVMQGGCFLAFGFWLLAFGFWSKSGAWYKTKG